jgi:hypothetical protein
MFGYQPVLERRCVAVDYDGMTTIMTVSEYDRVQQRAAQSDRARRSVASIAVSGPSENRATPHDRPE